jgi:hypothetical protein
MIKKIIIGLCLMGSFFILSGCGGNHAAPEGSTITITGPSEISDGRTSTSVNSAFFTIVVKNISGVPLNDVRIWITYLWAIPSEASLVQLYDGDTPQDQPMSVTTDTNGAFNLRLDYQQGGGLEYNGTIQVSSGSVVGTADFAVSSGSSS